MKNFKPPNKACLNFPLKIYQNSATIIFAMRDLSTKIIGIDARMFSDSFTGIGRYNFEITKRLFTKTHIYSGGEKYKIQWVIFLNNPEFSEFHFPSNAKKVLVNAPHYSFAEQVFFLKILQKEKCDLVHFTHFNLPLFFRGNFITTIHDTTLSFFPGKDTSIFKKIAYRLVIQKAVKSSRGIIAVSANTKKDITKLFHAQGNKISVIHNGISVDFSPEKKQMFESIQAKYKIPTAFLLYTGVWREHKNLKNLFLALQILYKKHKNFPGLVLTGNPDSKILEISEKGKFRQKIFPIGKIPIKDLAILMASNNAFVFPSLYEGFGIPPLEAMKSEVPVVCSNTSSLPEACGEAAEFFDPQNIQDIAKKIEMIVLGRSRKKELITLGFEQAKKFCWDKTANQTFEIYKKYL